MWIVLTKTGAWSVAPNCSVPSASSALLVPRQSLSIYLCCSSELAHLGSFVFVVPMVSDGLATLIVEGPSTVSINGVC